MPSPTQSSLTADKLLGKLYQEFAKGYHIAANNLAKDIDACADDSNLESMTRACHGAIFYVNQVLRCTYESYHTVPTGTWKRLHEIFRLAQTRDIDAEEFIDSAGDTVSICNEYKRGLLLGISEPYQLPYCVVNTVFDRLLKWATHARVLFDVNKEGGTGCLFIIDTRSDNPAVPCLPSSTFQNSERDLLLDTSVLVDKLNHEIATMLSSIRTNTGNLMTGLEHIQVLKTLITHWRVHPLRRERRSELHARRLVILGLTSICRELTGGRAVAAPTIDLSNPDDFMRGTFGHQIDLHKNSRILPHPWETIDESPSGIRFRVANLQIRVGQLVAFRPVESGWSWSIGVVRWTKRIFDETLDLGVYKLGKEVIPVKARPISEKAQDTSKEYSALFLPADPLIKRAQSLIVENGLYQPGQSLEIWSEASDYMVEATKLILAGQPFDWFEIASGINRELTFQVEYSADKATQPAYSQL